MHILFMQMSMNFPSFLGQVIIVITLTDAPHQFEIVVYTHANLIVYIKFQMSFFIQK